MNRAGDTAFFIDGRIGARSGRSLLADRMQRGLVFGYSLVMHEADRRESNVVHLDNTHETEIIQRAAEAVRREGVVVYLSDTIYGLGCAPWSEKALRRLFQIKGRPPDKGVLLLISSIEMGKSLVGEAPEGWTQLAGELWPGPFTLLLPARPELPELVRGSENKVGLRIPDSAFLRAWIEAIPGPLVSTSANLSGQKVPGSFEEVLRDFGARVDLLIDGGEPVDSQPSTVIDVCASSPRIVRAGRDVSRALELIGFRRGNDEANQAPGHS